MQRPRRERDGHTATVPSGHERAANVRPSGMLSAFVAPADHESAVDCTWVRYSGSRLVFMASLCYETARRSERCGSSVACCGRRAAPELSEPRTEAKGVTMPFATYALHDGTDASVVPARCGRPMRYESDRRSTSGRAIVAGDGRRVSSARPPTRRGRGGARPPDGS